MSDWQLKGGEARLWQLVEERGWPGADTARIDQRIWDLFGDEAAIMMTDLAGFSRRVATFGITHFLQVILESKKLLMPVIGEHDGVLIKTEADSLLVLFKRPQSAARCAIAMQHACQRYNRDRKEDERVELCVGIGHGRILRIGDIDVYGREVNAASKLGEDTARPNEILLTDAARTAVGDLPGVRYADLAVAVAGSDRNHRLLYEPAP
jgi:class 3 adenylate cyclase